MLTHAAFSEAAERVLDGYIASVDDPYAVTHRIQITSYGGSGTTALRDHCQDAGLDVPRSPDSWPFKHARVPPAAADVPDGFRAIYVYGDPRDAVRSIFRRGLQLGHYSLLHDLRRPSPEVEARLESLERYTEAGIDDFGLEEHFDNWAAAAGYPVLLLRFESLPTTWPTVATFLGLPSGHPAPPVLTRHVPDDTSSSTFSSLTAMHAALLRRIESIEPVVISD